MERNALDGGKDILFEKEGRNDSVNDGDDIDDDEDILQSWQHRWNEHDVYHWYRQQRSRLTVLDTHVNNLKKQMQRLVSDLNSLLQIN